MAGNKQRPGRGAPGSSQSRLLQLLRKHGYTEDLPPSTVSWLDTRPAFRWLAENLNDDNFVDSETQALYESIQLQGCGGAAAAGGAQARAQLMSAMGIESDSGSDDEGRGGDGGGDAGGGASSSHGGGGADGGWGEPQSIEDLEQAIEVRG
jgi:hypothetical protein